MKTRSVEAALILLSSVPLLAATPVFSDFPNASPNGRTNKPPLPALAPPRSPAAVSNHPIQQITLDPLQVIRVPVATDRLTTLRFPSPVSDLASAMISTEPHPSALFQMTFHPGESFFSVRALRAKASTTLNVVWKSQTFVFLFDESSDPWLSVILTAPSAIRSDRPPVAPVLGPRETSNPADKYLDVARNFASLKRDFARSMEDVDRVEATIHRQLGTLRIRITEVLHFRAARVGVARIVFSNPSGAPVDLGIKPVHLFHEGQPVSPIGSDFDGTIPAFSDQTALIVFQFPSRGTVSDPTNLRLTVPALEPAAIPSKP